MKLPVLENLLSFRNGRSWVFDLSGHREQNFVLYNCGEHDSLSTEPISDRDLVPIEAKANSRYTSETWSCNIDWYFVVLPTGIALINVFTSRGFFCKRRSWAFIEAFINAPQKRRG